MSRPTVDKAIRELEEFKLISVTRGKPGKNKRQPVNQYSLPKLDPTRIPEHLLNSGLFGPVDTLGKEFLQELDKPIGCDDEVNLVEGIGDAAEGGSLCEYADECNEIRNDAVQNDREWSAKPSCSAYGGPPPAVSEPAAVRDEEVSAALTNEIAYRLANADSPDDDGFPFGRRWRRTSAGNSMSRASRSKPATAAPTA